MPHPPCARLAPSMRRITLNCRSSSSSSHNGSTARPSKRTPTRLTSRSSATSNGPQATRFQASPPYALLTAASSTTSTPTTSARSANARPPWRWARCTDAAKSPFVGRNPWQYGRSTALLITLPTVVPVVVPVAATAQMAAPMTPSAAELCWCGTVMLRDSDSTEPRPAPRTPMDWMRCLVRLSNPDSSSPAPTASSMMLPRESCLIVQYTAGRPVSSASRVQRVARRAARRATRPAKATA